MKYPPYDPEAEEEIQRMEALDKQRRERAALPAVGSTEWLSGLRGYQEKLTDSQRLELWLQITHDYCTHCGRREHGQRCQCWNDE